jgi:hypothetical protein
MKVLIAGSRCVTAGDNLTYPPRKFTDEEIAWFFECVKDYHKRYPITEIISGGAAGVDRMGELYGEFFKVPVKQFLPDWKKYGKSAGFKRNAEMVEYADRVIVFWDSHSKGTKHTIDLTERSHKPLTIWRFDYFDA